MYLGDGNAVKDLLTTGRTANDRMGLESHSAGDSHGGDVYPVSVRSESFWAPEWKHETRGSLD